MNIYTSENEMLKAELNQFKPDWDAMAVMVEEQQRMAKRIEELEALAQPEYRAVKTYHEGEPVYVAQQEQNLNCKSTQARLATAWGYVKAQPEQESFEYWNAVEGWVKIDEVREHFDSVGCGTIYKTAGEDRTPLYTTPPQRKPLTDEEMYKIWLTVPAETKDRFAFARAIEAAHGIGDNT